MIMYLKSQCCCTSKPSVLEAIWLNKLHVNIDIATHETWHQKRISTRSDSSCGLRWILQGSLKNGMYWRYYCYWDSKRSQIVRPIFNMLCIQVDLWILLVARNFQLLDCMWLHFGSYTSWSLHAGMYLACVQRVECVKQNTAPTQKAFDFPDLCIASNKIRWGTSYEGSDRFTKPQIRLQQAIRV